MSVVHYAPARTATFCGKTIMHQIKPITSTDALARVTCPACIKAEKENRK